jgi:hypothetical protein
MMLMIANAKRKREKRLSDREELVLKRLARDDHKARLYKIGETLKQRNL